MHYLREIVPETGCTNLWQQKQKSKLQPWVYYWGEIQIRRSKLKRRLTSRDLRCMSDINQAGYQLIHYSWTTYIKQKLCLGTFVLELISLPITPLQ